MTTRPHAKWQQPTPPTMPEPTLTLYNSLTRSKVPFVPAERRKVTWYCCGPTVYDASHLGHARNYLTTDVLRRVLRDYFSFDVRFVQNVTDIDDKIIIRAREEHFLAEYKATHPQLDLADTRSAYAWALGRFKLPETAPADFAAWADTQLVGTAVEDDEVKRRNNIKALRPLATAISSGQPAAGAECDAVLGQWLGDTLKATVPADKYAIFADFTRHWEAHFNADLRTLNILPPTITTRVSEFVPENAAFVQRIVDNGFAYDDGAGSVYFDIAAFERAGHTYAKLEPGARDNAARIAEGEGALGAKLARDPRDFALWKASAPGEPSWPSPWGLGRPGWHIECSAMCCAVLGDHVDIHSGGIDLAFPHHDNELAQSEAHYASDQWVSYFLHMGHLSIAGSKMSKSLKNFVTIREALASGDWTPRRLRAVFMMGGWRAGIEITPDMRRAVEVWEATLDNYFVSVNALLAEGGDPPHLFREQERALYAELDAAKRAMHAALCDSIDTARALEILADTVSRANVYLRTNSPSAAHPTAYFSRAALAEIARWVARMVDIFGFGRSTEPAIGWAATTPTAGEAGKRDEALVRVLSSFRDTVKARARAGGDVLDACDAVRDALLPLGVALEDRDSAVGAPALVKFAPAAELLAAREEKRRAAAERDARGAAVREKEARAAAAKAEKARVRPQDLFRTAAYSEWDEDGLPVKDAQGEPLSKTESKKVKKAWDAQKKLYETHGGDNAQ